MAEPTITKDKFIIDHVDFGLREQANYPNGGTSKFYDNGTDMVIIDEDIVTKARLSFHICLLLISRIIICTSLIESFVF